MTVRKNSAPTVRDFLRFLAI